MKIGLIGMRCEECGSRENSFDERMGERICDDCGLVLVTEVFEETVSRNIAPSEFRSSDHAKLGSKRNFSKVGRTIVSSLSQTDSRERRLENGYRTMRMVISSLELPFDIVERTEEVYRQTLAAGILSGRSLEVRATAIVYFVLKENRTPFTYEEVCAEFGVNRSLVKKLIRKIQKHYGNSVILQDDSDFQMQRAANLAYNNAQFVGACMQTKLFFDDLLEQNGLPKHKTYYATIVYLTSYQMGLFRTLSANKIAKKLKISANGIRNNGRRLLALTSVKSVNDLQGKTWEQMRN
tara:strand:- start:60 stop:941 length:882 start_codon:yes stop_codon:yes gene_type:complete